MQVLCSDLNEDMEKTCIYSCARQALVVRNKRYKRASVSTSTLYCNNKLLRQELLEKQWHFFVKLLHCCHGVWIGDAFHGT